MIIEMDSRGRCVCVYMKIKEEEKAWQNSIISCVPVRALIETFLRYPLTMERVGFLLDHSRSQLVVKVRKKERKKEKRFTIDRKKRRRAKGRSLTSLSSQRVKEVQ